MYTYNWLEWMTFFYIYCILGWVFESSYVSIKKGHFVNRGFLRGPMLPLYGTGAIMMLWVSLPFKGNLLLVYISGLIGATALELVTGVVMEKLFRVKYWDYSNQKIQYKGYICLSSSVAWGFFTILLTEVIHKPIEHFVLGFNHITLLWIVCIISAMFLIDTIESTKAALNLAKALEAMTKVRSELEDIQVQMALLKSETEQKVSALKVGTQQRVSDFKTDTGRKISNIKSSASRRLEDVIAEYELRLSELSERYGSRPEYLAFKNKLSSLREKLPSLPEYTGPSFSNYRRMITRGILRGNPDATSKFSEALAAFKEAANRRKL